jgi:hypothetical protein
MIERVDNDENVTTTHGSLNPFARNGQQPVATVEADRQRAIAEVLAALEIANRMPRNPVASMDRILIAFQRATLARQAIYVYSRGGTEITGPTIRAAEAIAQSWGNMQFGVRELERRPAESTVEAFAWDVETNTRSTITFQLKHVRDTKKGRVVLTDERDIYETMMNQGARRKRACILSVIPGDVVEGALKQARNTLEETIKIDAKFLETLVKDFASFDVTREMLEARIQRRLGSIAPAQAVGLQNILNSLRDGMSVASNWFQAPEDPKSAKDAPESGIAERLRTRRAQRSGGEKEEPNEAPAAATPGVDPHDNGIYNAADHTEDEINDYAEDYALRKGVEPAEWMRVLSVRGEKGRVTHRTFKAIIARVDEVAPQK